MPSESDSDTAREHPHRTQPEAATGETLPAAEALSHDRTLPAAGERSHDRTLPVAEALSRDRTLPAAGLPSAMDDIMEGRRSGAPAPTAPVALRVVDRGLYARQAEVARGGMGRIVAARDRRHDRPVALKELLSSTASAHARFEREAFITARLQHPAIIPIYEAGRWSDGEPFFAMKMVDGIALDKAIATRPTLADRLELLPNVAAVCDALAYAHHRGVIHRDLKPANVLVGEYGETVVIDWGLAKDLRQDGDPIAADAVPSRSCEGLVTVAGATLGTPAYMPPEQARGEPADERADVYALGALLYHLLGGKPAYEESKNADEAIGRVIAGPPRPLAELEPGIPPDLLAIVTKAMARDPDDRYSAAKAMADDLRRFETGQLVSVHEYSALALVGRWLARHRAVVGVAAVALLVLGVAAVVGVQRIRDERSFAQEQHHTAEAHRAELEDLLAFMLVDLRDKLRPIGRLDLLDMVAQRADAYYQQRPLDLANPTEAANRAFALTNLGEVHMARGNLDQALVLFTRAHQIRERLVRLAPDDLTLFRDFLVTVDKIAKIAATRGDTEEALRRFRQSLDLAEQLVGRDPDNLDWQFALATSHERVGTALRRRGDLDEALHHFERALALHERLVEKRPAATSWQRSVAMSHDRIGAVLQDRGDLEGALRHFQPSHDIVKGLAEAKPDDSLLLHSLAVSHGRLGGAQAARGDNDGALASYRECHAAYQRLVDREPTNVEWQRNLGVAIEWVGLQLQKRGELGEALEQFRRTLPIRERLVAQTPDDPRHHRDLAIAHLNISSVYRGLGDRHQALAHLRADLALRERMVADRPDDLRSRRDLARSHLRIASELADTHQPDDAGAELIAARSTLDADDAQSRIDLALACIAVSHSLDAAGAPQRARARFLECAEVLSAIAKAPVDFYNIACCHALAGNQDAAFEWLARSLAAGYSDTQGMRRDPDLAALHGDPRWRDLLGRTEE